MWKNYIKIAFRNFRKNAVFSAINLAGLAVGMAACLLILQYVSFELSYDQFNEHAPSIYRVINDRYQNGKLIQHGTITYSAIGKALKDDYPQEIENYTRVEPMSNMIVSYKNKKLEEQALAVDNSFFSIFSYPLLAGDRATVLAEPHTLILSESLARKIFGYQSNDLSAVLGNMLVLQRDSLPYKITGICKDIPENSQLQCSFFISYSSLYTGLYHWKEADYDFTDSDFWHYILLRPGVNYKILQSKFPAFSQRHFQGNKISGSDEKFYLQPLSRAHLYSDFEYDIAKTGNATTVWGLLIIALFTIIIAWVNYINLSTAKSVERAKEVGVRKVVGAGRAQLMRQFLVESLSLNLVSLVLAVLLVLLVQSWFNHLLSRNLSLLYLFQKGLNGYSISGGLMLVLLLGILASGFYPAFALSSFKPITVLKGKLSSSSKGIVLRKALVIGQFAITVALVVGSIVVYRQIRYMSSQQLGLNIDQMMIVKPPVLTNWDSTFISRVDNFKEEIKQIVHVKGAATSNRLPGDELGRAFDVHRIEDSSGNHFTLRNWGIAYDFMDLYAMKLLAGRKFFPSDHNPDFNKLHSAILNVSAVKLLGFRSLQDAVGKQIFIYGKPWDIVGVAADFHQKSLHHPIEPTVLFPLYSTSGPISVKVSSSDPASTISLIRKKYEAFFPGNLFDYYFLDEKFNEQYQDDQLFGRVFALFAGLAIFIACLGLFGLSLHATLQRTKEIGVRKVLGASVSNIVVLLTRSYLKLVLGANLIAIPVAWLIMNNWLRDFPYRIHISWWVFVLSSIMALLVALCTISFQAIKAAVANPVKNLRTE